MSEAERAADGTAATLPFRFPGRPLSGPEAWPLRAVAGILAASQAVFLVRMLSSPALGLAACALMAVSLWPLFAPRREEADTAPPWGLWLACGLVALGLFLLGGEGRLFYANADWQVRDAVLADMARGPWPVAYPGGDGAAAWVLRAPLGMYVLPALFGWAGLPATHLALLAQNSLLLGAVLAVVLAGFPRWRERLILLAVLFAASGWDIVGFAFVDFRQPDFWMNLFPHLEVWANDLQYSSMATVLFWTPHHSLPAFAMAAAYLAWRRGRASWLHLAAVTGLGLLWSPFAVMGAAPFVVLAGVLDLVRGRMAPLAPALLAPLAAATLPCAVFVALDTGGVERGSNVGPGFWPLWALFIVVELAPLLYLALRRLAQEPTARGDWLLAAGLLLAMPLYRIGTPNNFVMRASIFPLLMLAAMAASALAADLGAGRWRRSLLPLAVLAVGAFTPGAEIVRALVEPVNPPRADGFIEAWDRSDFSALSKAPYLASGEVYRRRAWLLKPPA